MGEADVIARASVTSVSSQWVDSPQGRMIETFVSFAVEKQLKGTPSTSLTLQFLGGTVGTDTLRVAGMPEFKVGETEILFVRGNGVQFCPLVRFMHGRYHVRTDASSQHRYVARDDGLPLNSVTDVQLPEQAGPAAATRSAATAMAPEDFESQVSSEISRQQP